MLQRVKHIIQVVLFSAAVAVPSAVFPAAIVHAASPALCFDALAGITTQCADTPTLPVDGKAPSKGIFAAGKCYTLSDAAKGWVSQSDCSGDVFQAKNVVQAQTASGSTDNAAKGGNNCPTELDPQQQCSIVRQYLNPIINTLAVVVVLAAVISIIVAGIQYSTSADQPNVTAAAQQRIINAVIAIIAFGFLWAFLQWITPGGIL